MHLVQEMAQCNTRLSKMEEQMDHLYSLLRDVYSCWDWDDKSNSEDSGIV